jgi:hypothetical protein
MPSTPAMIELLPRLQSEPMEKVRSTPKKRLPTYTLAVLVVVFTVLHLALAIIAEVSPTLRDPACADKLTKLKKLTTPPKIIQFGSSRTLLGFKPDELDEPAMNFGLPASGLFTSAVSLQRVLSRGMTPDVVIVELLPTMLMDGVEEQFLTTERLSRSELDWLKSLGFDDSITGLKQAGRWAAPWFAIRMQIVGRLLPSWLPEEHRHDWGRKTDANGWTTPPRQTIDSDERQVREAKVREEYGNLLATLTPGERALNAACWIEQTCAELGIQLVFVLMPEGSNFSKMYGPGAEERLQTWLKQLKAPVIDARSWLTDDETYDGHHAFARGATKYTMRLNQALCSGGTP